MSRSDIAVFSLILLLALGLASTAFAIKHQQAMVVRYGQPLDVSAAWLLDGRSDIQQGTNGGYTLVEFGDYQCPPCRATVRPLQEVLKRYGTKLGFDFRNMPLTSIHPFAMRAAVAAEAAREQGKFWLMHDYLYKVDLANHSPDACAAAIGLDLKKFRHATASSAKMAVESDEALAMNIGVRSTPTLILCTPDGHVLRLHSFSQLDSSMSQ
jgi:protein-disulfide isomerase